MQLKVTRQWPFIKRARSINTVKQDSLTPTDTQSSKWYQNISDLPLTRFIDVMVDGNLYALVITGKPTELELHKAWAEIQLQYADAMKDNEFRLLNSLMKEVHRLSITLDQIHMAIDQLKQRYVEKFAKLLNGWLGSSFKFDTRFPEDYEKDLQRAYNRSKGIKIELTLKRSRYEALQKKFSSRDKKPTREYFMALLITLSDHVKYRIPDSITVFEYCERIRRLNQYFETMQTKFNGRRAY